MSRRTGPTIASVTGLAGLVLAGLAATAPVQARADAPPVTTPDEVTLLPFGGHANLRLADNDQDDHGLPSLCRVRSTSDVEMSLAGRRASVTAWAEDAGDYTAQYQACDTRYLSIGTLTVHVVAPQDVTVAPVDGVPGVLEAHNPNPVRVALLWGHPRASDAEGDVRLPAGATRRFTVTHHHVVWVAFDPSTRADDPAPIGYGDIRGIELPPSRATGSPPPERDQRWWRGRSPTPRSTVPRGQAAVHQPWPADPTTLAPPTPHRDSLDLWVGGRIQARHLLRNDTDPQGQSLDICRYDDNVLAAPGTPYVRASLDDGKLTVTSRRRVAGTFDVDYYVCNAGRLAPAQLRVHLRWAQPLVVHRLGPGLSSVRVHNPNGVLALLAVGAKQARSIAGPVPPHSTRILHVSLRKHVWRGYALPSYGYAGRGRLTPTGSA